MFMYVYLFIIYFIYLFMIYLFFLFIYIYVCMFMSIIQCSWHREINIRLLIWKQKWNIDTLIFNLIYEQTKIHFIIHTVTFFLNLKYDWYLDICPMDNKLYIRNIYLSIWIDDGSPNVPQLTAMQKIQSEWESKYILWYPDCKKNADRTYTLAERFVLADCTGIPRMRYQACIRS